MLEPSRRSWRGRSSFGSQTSEALSSLIGTVRSWLGSHDDRRVRIELDGDVIELSGATDEERERLVDTWIERHGHS